MRNLAELHCLDVRNGELDAAAQAVGDCHGLANQRWTRDGQWLRTEVNSQCLSIQNNGDPSEHAGINVRNCGNVAWQFWKGYGLPRSTRRHPSMGMCSCRPPTVGMPEQCLPRGISHTCVAVP
ncbi:RICIN domain-containing protein [Streptomyces sp. NPDC057686]|uniref:RICIN domain-containing protein n=1 Tax=Streptomyces sp. NPDC057686 TaxID=3346212 RepID=UPI0036B98F68